MKVSSIRYHSFATNSSSVHTPILWTGSSPKNFLANKLQFCGSRFVLSTEYSRRRYAAIALLDSLRSKAKFVDGVLTSDCNPVDGNMIETIKEWAQVRGNRVWKNAVIDHQSLPLIPHEYNRSVPSRKFFDDFLSWILQEHLVIVGGNDESNRRLPFPIKGEKIQKPYPVDTYPPSFYSCRYDPRGFYTIMDRVHGTKIRMSFDDKADMSKSTYPELVDLKITNRCHRGCQYCYQNSSDRGPHASMNKVSTILKALSSLQVLEVAIGGGEPTLHPDFWNIVKEARALGITPNFSTRLLGWTRLRRELDTFLECCGAFAYSVDCPEEIDFLARELEGKEFSQIRADSKVTIQVVLRPELGTRALIALVDRAYKNMFPLTLLGFKDSGRGKEYRQGKRRSHPINWSHVFESTYRIGVDTAFVQQHKEVLEHEKIAPWSYDIKEGAHSMYIDAVSMSMGPSSYSSKMEPLEAPNSLRTQSEIAYAFFRF